MDGESLKIILKLQEENTLLHRAIDEAIVMLGSRKKFFHQEYDITNISWLFRNIFKVLDDLGTKTYFDKDGNRTESAFDENGNPHSFKYLHEDGND